MYLNLGQTVLPIREVVGIFDLDNTSWAYKTREFLERADREDRAVWLTRDLPRSFVLCRDGKIYVTQLSAGVLKGRAKLPVSLTSDMSRLPARSCGGHVPLAHTAPLFKGAEGCRERYVSEEKSPP